MRPQIGRTARWLLTRAACQEVVVRSSWRTGAGTRPYCPRNLLVAASYFLQPFLRFLQVISRFSLRGLQPVVEVLVTPGYTMRPLGLERRDGGGTDMGGGSLLFWWLGGHRRAGRTTSESLGGGS